MAFQPNPEVLVQGTVASISDRSFDGKPKGRAVGVFTRTGFVEVRVPVSLDAEGFEEGQPVLLAVDQNFWSMVDETSGAMKHGLALTLNHVLDPAQLKASVSAK